MQNKITTLNKELVKQQEQKCDSSRRSP